MDILFMGTPEFAATSLQALYDGGHNIVGVFTQADRVRGRGSKLTPTPVKELALSLGLKVFQPSSLRDDTVFELIESLNPQMIVVVAYGKILPKRILDFPKYGCVNIHASLLPKYRGAAPIQWAIINGESETGVTSMLMNEGMDTGDILLVQKTPIGEKETSADLFDRLAGMGAKLLIETIDSLEAGKISPQKQNESDASYAPMLDKSMCEIDWKLPADQIDRLIRGLSPFLCACSSFDGKRVKVIEADVSDLTCDLQAGELLDEEGTIKIVCGDNTALEVKVLQPEGKKPMKSHDFLRGHRPKKNN